MDKILYHRMHHWSLMELFNWSMKTNISQYEQIVADQKCTFKSMTQCLLSIFSIFLPMYHCI